MNDNEDICEPLKIRRLDINDRISNFNFSKAIQQSKYAD